MAASGSERLTALAATAVERFGILDGRLLPLTATENDTFRVDLPVPGRSARWRPRFVLRVHRPGAKARDEIESELSWLAALRAETRLAVPDPVAAPDGQRVLSFSSDGRLCVLFRWLDGHFVPREIAPELFARVGELAGRLHAHAAGWTPPPGFRRGRLDADAVARDLAPDAPFIRSLARSDRDLVARVVDRFAAAADRLGTGPDAFSLVHADLHQFNVLFHRGTVRAIDFDDCGWGHYLYDIAVALVGAGFSRDDPAWRSAFLAGYRRHRDLPTAQEAHLGTFMGVRRLILLRWALGGAPVPAVTEGTVVGEVLGKVRSELAAG